jgi:hypothetical protein
LLARQENGVCISGILPIENIKNVPQGASLPIKRQQGALRRRDYSGDTIQLWNIHSKYKSKLTFINDSLLKNRHSIVHGEYLDIHFDEFKQVLNTTLEIIETIKDLLLDSSINAFYRK